MKIKEALWGALFLVIGALMLLDTYQVISVNIFFPGWWAILLTFYGLVEFIQKPKEKIYIFVMVVGICLFALINDFVTFELLYKTAIPLVLIGVGCSLIYSNIKNTSK